MKPPSPLKIQKPIRNTILAAVLVGAAISGQSAQAAIVVVGPTASTTGSLQITADITFLVTVAGNAKVVFLDEWVTADGTPYSSIIMTPAIQYAVNAGSTTLGFGTSIMDNGAAGVATSNDGWLLFHGGTGVPLIVGDSFTLKAGNYTINAGANFNPLATQTFTGNVFLGGDAGILGWDRMSDNVSLAAVPEPSSLLAAASGLGILLRRRRR